MKTIKRILAVALLIITLTAVGYFVYTGSRFSFKEEDYQALIGNTYISKNNDISVRFEEDYSIEYTVGNVAKTLQENTLKDGVIICQYSEEEYRFVIISEQTIFDVNRKQILWRIDDE